MKLSGRLNSFQSVVSAVSEKDFFRNFGEVVASAIEQHLPKCVL